MTRDHRPKRFVVLHHMVEASFERTSESHFDWMFEQQDALQTFATPVIELLGTQVEFSHSIDREAQQLPQHRMEYLDYEGEISAGRGRVRRVIAGTFACHKESENEFISQLTWQGTRGTQQAAAAFYRILSDGLRFNVNRDAWRLRLTL